MCKSGAIFSVTESGNAFMIYVESVLKCLGGLLGAGYPAQLTGCIIGNWSARCPNALTAMKARWKFSLNPGDSKCL